MVDCKTITIIYQEFYFLDIVILCFTFAYILVRLVLCLYLIILNLYFIREMYFWHICHPEKCWNVIFKILLIKAWSNEYEPMTFYRSILLKSDLPQIVTKILVSDHISWSCFHSWKFKFYLDKYVWMKKIRQMQCIKSKF